MPSPIGLVNHVKSDDEEASKDEESQGTSYTHREVHIVITLRNYLALSSPAENVHAL